jgi:hypothetical protein
MCKRGSISIDDAITTNRGNLMRKKAPKHKSRPTDSLLKTSKKKDIELTEKELGQVTGGRKAGKGQQEFLTFTMKHIIIT